MSEDLAVFYARRRLFYDALRGPRFKQGTGTLTRYPGDPDEQNCCLGVGCTVARENGLPLRYRDEDGTRYYLATAYEFDDQVDLEDDNDAYSNAYSNSYDLPEAVRKWYGFTENDPELEVVLYNRDADAEFMTTASASTLNDDKGFNFAQIADAFEAKYPCAHEPEEPHGLLEP